ncbi:DUF3906 family protein [Paenibacillus sp. J2TS4]|uniref:DUF3906 family protein n=1 Tax=Paenibacillus sp. J2TS4 TaxID=2807194 RepID=UPI001AFDC35B|nr:DUF3906 family protein [Paenibacillus sp. J2TS4]GIP35211.1 hypothetical protein J2TS4_44210 [Paenibacillus sp. J2TS4]
MAESNSESYLYKLEAILADERQMTVIVVSSSDEKAFVYAENNLLRHTVAPPGIQSLGIVEKKPLVRDGVGYTVETLQFD